MEIILIAKKVISIPAIENDFLGDGNNLIGKEMTSLARESDFLGDGNISICKEMIFLTMEIRYSV